MTEKSIGRCVSRMKQESEGMAILTWNAELSVHIKSIDAQHQKLIDLINSLQKQISIGMGKDNVAPVLAELLGYIVSHFKYEEKLMSDKGYPEYSAHKKEHAGITAQVRGLSHTLGSGKPISSPEMSAVIKNCLTQHIMSADKSYSSFLIEKGVK